MWEKTGSGLDLRIVNKIISALEGGYPSEGSEKEDCSGISKGKLT